MANSLQLTGQGQSVGSGCLEFTHDAKVIPWLSTEEIDPSFAPTPAPEVVAESLIEGLPARPLAVPDRHQGLGRPPEAPFPQQGTSWLRGQEAAPGPQRYF